MKTRLLLILVISLLLAGCGKDKAGAPSAEENSNQKTNYVKTVQVGTGDFNRVLSLPGYLQPSEQAVITSKVSGTVQKTYVDIGARVGKGQALCKIDDTNYALQHKRALSGFNSEQVRYEDAEKNYERMKQLYENKVISKADFENVESQFKMAKENLNRARYDLELAAENLRETNITSPLSGIVSFRDVSDGENIGPGKTIFTVVNTDSMFVETGVAEQDIIAVKTGQRAMIKIDSLKGHTFEGLVTHVGPVPDHSAKTYPVKITVRNKDNLLKSGMFASVEILLDERKGSLSVPKEAVLTEDGRRYVFVERDGKVEKRLIELGYSSDSAFEVLNGLKSDEKVVSVGHDNLTDGSQVEVR